MVGGVSHHHFTQFVDEVCFEFLLGGSNGKMRFQRLPAPLMTMHEFSHEYWEFALVVEQEAAKLGYSPQELQDSRDWPEIDW